MPKKNEDSDTSTAKLARENNRLLKENNELLRKIHRHSMLNIVFKVVWLMILIGLPFAVYFYVLEPYLEVFGANYESFRMKVESVPGLGGLELILPDIAE